MMLCRSKPMTMVPTTLVFTLLMFCTSVKPNTALDRDAKKRATSVRPSLRRSSTSSLTNCTMNLIFSRIAASSPNNGFRVLEGTSLPISSSLRPNVLNRGRRRSQILPTPLGTTCAPCWSSALGSSWRRIRRSLAPFHTFSPIPPCSLSHSHSHGFLASFVPCLSLRT